MEYSPGQHCVLACCICSSITWGTQCPVYRCTIVWSLHPPNWRIWERRIVMVSFFFLQWFFYKRILGGGRLWDDVVLEEGRRICESRDEGWVLRKNLTLLRYDVSDGRISGCCRVVWLWRWWRVSLIRKVVSEIICFNMSYICASNESRLALMFCLSKVLIRWRIKCVSMEDRDDWSYTGVNSDCYGRRSCYLCPSRKVNPNWRRVMS